MCPTCGNQMNSVCGEDVCGTCYGRWLETEKVPGKLGLMGYTMEYNQDKHVDVVVPKLYTRDEVLRMWYGPKP